MEVNWNDGEQYTTESIDVVSDVVFEMCDLATEVFILGLSVTICFS